MANEVPGNMLTGALWNANVAALGNFVTAVPVFYGIQTVAQSIVGTAVILLDAENLDSDGGHSTVTNTGRYTPTVPGLYLVLCTGAFAINATGTRAVQVRQNGAVIRSSQSVGAAHAQPFCGNTWALAQCNGTTDWVEMFVSTGGLTLNSYVGLDMTSAMAVFWISS